MNFFFLKIFIFVFFKKYDLKIFHGQRRANKTYKFIPIVRIEKIWAMFQSRTRPSNGCLRSASAFEEAKT